MSRLLTILYDVAEIRLDCQRVHDERFGLSPRRVLRAITGKVSASAAPEPPTGLEHLRERLQRAGHALDELRPEDVDIRRGREINDTLRDYIDALSGTLERLDRLCRHGQAEPSPPAGDDSTALKIAYDDALQHQKRLASRLNDLISGL